ncbi:SGNH/GDSL hydrolase family protein [Ramlibacter humi]|uniref:GDSL family lipase n=1 Tax=Ramlibacter humi TaxID=2530451 RepID=A0A4Z0BVJ9_9BURK|nr:SGNH/GDSL hydrolase family protein [Ramlibacter humi]TFZ02029.1 GDSL family lipase [Ramlibacter humi]
MPFQRLRRALLPAACAVSLLLAACGGGKVVSQFAPARAVALGDAFSDAGRRGSQYSINDSTTSNWTQRLAANYNLSLASTASGGNSYAIGSARVALQPDAQGNAATPTVTDQVTAYLTSGVQSDDLVIIGAGTADLIVEEQAAIAGTQSDAQANANVRQAGTQLGAQIKRLVDAGVKHIIVAGVYNIGRSPWAIATGRAVAMEALATNFNDGLKIAIVDLGANVLYVDAALQFNLVTASPATYGYTDVTTVTCNSVDPGVGIGIGAGQVNSALCTGATLTTGSPGSFLFADKVYLTPAGNATLGDYAFQRSKDRW